MFTNNKFYFVSVRHLHLHCTLLISSFFI